MDFYKYIFSPKLFREYGDATQVNNYAYHEMKEKTLE